jgi:hypothetical protein
LEFAEVDAVSNAVVLSGTLFRNRAIIVRELTENHAEVFCDSRGVLREQYMSNTSTSRLRRRGQTSLA